MKPRNMPDGVGRVQFNSDGSLKSLCVKATVPIEDALGVTEGKDMARTEADLQAKQRLSEYIKEDFVGVEFNEKNTSFFTKSSTDDKGKKIVVTADQTNKLSTIRTDITSNILKAVKTIFSEVIPSKKGNDKAEYVVVLVFDTKDITAAQDAAGTMSGNGVGANGPSENETKIAQDAAKY